jgi:hypothetical protein
MAIFRFGKVYSSNYFCSDGKLLASMPPRGQHPTVSRQHQTVMKPKVKLLTFTAKNIKMKQLLFLFLLIGFSSNIYGQTFLNGSFEINNATYCMINNIKNAQFNLLMNNVRGIGEAETIDIFYDKICPSYGSAQSGHYFVSVENNGKDSTQSTIISLKLTDPLQNGMPYNFFFYDKSINLGNNSVKIGVSNTDSTFGTLIYTTSFNSRLKGWLVFGLGKCILPTKFVVG